MAKIIADTNAGLSVKDDVIAVQDDIQTALQSGQISSTAADRINQDLAPMLAAVDTDGKGDQFVSATNDLFTTIAANKTVGFTNSSPQDNAAAAQNFSISDIDQRHA